VRIRLKPILIFMTASLLFALAAGFMLTLPVAAEAQPQAANKVSVYMFWGDGCPHCAAEKPFLESLAKANPAIELKFYEVWYVPANQEIFIKFAKAYGFEPHAVPTTFIGNRYWEGFNDQIKADMQSAINACLAAGCPDAGQIVESGGAAKPTQSPQKPGETAQDVIDVPLFGKVDLRTQSLFVSTLLISFVDGFNPCSVWVLSMLLALTLHTGSRRKVVIIGLVFLTVTALIYALFIAGLFTIFTVVSFVGWIQVVVALVALFFAVVNIKDYFWYKEGLSFTIADESKPGIFQKMRRVMDASQSMWGLVGATIVMAAGVSLVEFSCTAGFPVLWTNLLAAQNVTPVTFILLLLVYMLIYQLDELGIFFVAVYTLKASKLEEKQGRILKLIGGMLMLTLAVVMLVNPNLMNNLNASLVIFGAAFGAALLVLLVHRVILPRLGIRIGTELNPKTRKRGKK